MGHKLRVLLGLAPADFNYFGTEEFSLPLGLGSMATYLDAAMGRQAEVKVLDGTNFSQTAFAKEIKRFNPSLAGFQSTIGNHKNTLLAGRIAKNSGAFVVLGGHNATFLYKEILQNREFIDGVIAYEAELPFQQLAKRISRKKPTNGVLGLVRKSKNGFVFPPAVVAHNLNLLPTINYDFFDLQRHFEKSAKAGFGSAINYYSGRGCVRRAASSIIAQKSTSHSFIPFEQFERTLASMNSCAFCGRMDMGNRIMDDGKVKKLLDALYFEKGVRFFWDVWDTYCPREGPKMVNGDETFRFFARIDEIDPAYIALQKKRFGKNILLQIGLESGSKETFSKMNKMIGLNKTQIFKRLLLLKKEGIRIDPSFVLGVEGESQKSLEETMRFIKQVISLGNVRWLLLSPLTLLPGSPFFKRFMSIPEMQRKYQGKDLLDAVEMNQDYLSLFSSVSRNEIIESIREIKESLPDGVRLGCKGITKKEGHKIGITTNKK
ncbi:MAG: hypothetical protein NTW59_02885 [Candidatus Diapherotrites archaeon]|nr:hypothetical protein [Candidatus Diapherotrites archaeon]